MSAVHREKQEQISVERLVENAWTEFDLRLISIGALYVLWGSFATADELLERFLDAKGERHLLDRREHLSEAEQDRLDDIDFLAREAVQYRDWARDCDAQPILRDALVAYCVALENAFKSVASAFRAVPTSGRLKPQTFVAELDYKNIAKSVQKEWKKLGRQPGATALSFFRDEIFRRNPDPVRWDFQDPESDQGARFGVSASQRWNTVGQAFELRNAIVHADGRPMSQIEIGKEVFFAGDELKITPATLRVVNLAFKMTLYPISPNAL